MVSVGCGGAQAQYSTASVLQVKYFPPGELLIRGLMVAGIIS